MLTPKWMQWEQTFQKANEDKEVGMPNNLNNMGPKVPTNHHRRANQESWGNSNSTNYNARGANQMFKGNNVEDPSWKPNQASLGVNPQ